MLVHGFLPKFGQFPIRSGHITNRSTKLGCSQVQRFSTTVVRYNSDDPTGKRNWPWRQSSSIWVCPRMGCPTKSRIQWFKKIMFIHFPWFHGNWKKKHKKTGATYLRQRIFGRSTRLGFSSSACAGNSFQAAGRKGQRLAGKSGSDSFRDEHPLVLELCGVPFNFYGVIYHHF